MEQVKILKIFIGSPGDLQEERREAYNVIDRINKHLGKNVGIYIDLRGWEDTLPGTSRPQENINEDLKSCNMFLGVLWKRWGQPTGKYSSGFEEEFEIAQSLHKTGKMDDIWLFFKEISSDQLEDPGEQLQNVLNFKKRVIAERNLLFKTFDNTETWSKLLTDFLADYLSGYSVKQIQESSKGNVQDLQHITPPGDDNKKNQYELIDILSSLTEGLKVNKFPVELDHYEKVRLFLLSQSLVDERYKSNKFIGNHELHLLYYYRNRLDLIITEKNLILVSLLSDEFDLKCGWFWIKSQFITKKESLIDYTTISFPEKVRKQSLRYYLLIIKKPNFKKLKHLVFDESDSIKTEVIKIYKKYGRSEHVNFLKEIFEESSSEFAKSVWEATFAILVRQNQKMAIQFLMNSPDEKRGKIDEYFEVLLNDENIDQLKLLLNDKNEYLRSKAFNFLLEKMSDDDLLKWVNDTNTSIVSASYIELIRRNHNFDINEIEKRINEKSNKGSLARTLGYAFYHDDMEKIRFEINKRKEYEQLLDSILWHNTDTHINYIVLIEKFNDLFKEILRNDIKDGFDRIRKVLMKFIEDLRDKYGKEADNLYQNMEKNDEYAKCSLYKYALRALEIKSEERDLDLVQSIIQIPFSYFEVEIYNSCLFIFSKYGKNKHTQFLLKFIQKTTHKDLKIKTAGLILNLSKTNIQKKITLLLDEDAPEIKRLVFEAIPKEQFKYFEKNIVSHLYEENDKIRLYALAFLLRHLTRNEVENLQNQYLNSETYYYNVVCWIDRFLYCKNQLGNFFREKILNYLN
jgi:hypothetical protein